MKIKIYLLAILSVLFFTTTLTSCDDDEKNSPKPPKTEESTDSPGGQNDNDDPNTPDDPNNPNDPDNPDAPNDPDNPISEGYAPETLSGYTLSWNETYTLDGHRYGDGPLSLALINDEDCKGSWSASWSTYSYNKVTDNVGYLKFNIKQIIRNPSYYVRDFSYDVRLEFGGNNTFVMTGTKRLVSTNPFDHLGEYGDFRGEGTITRGVDI